MYDDTTDVLEPQKQQIIVNLYRTLTAHSARLAALELKLPGKAGFNRNQPRAPSGSPDGGQWTDGGGIRNHSHHALTNSEERNNAIGQRRYRYTLTVHSNKKITVRHSDGSLETRMNGSRSWRNNNPGNIISGAFANRHGAIGDNNGFAVFPDEATGRAASEALLRTSTYSRLTIDEAIARRSPQNENDVPAVQHNVRVVGKFSGKEIVGDLTHEQMARLIDAIKKTEGWQPGVIGRTP